MKVLPQASRLASLLLGLGLGLGLWLGLADVALAQYVWLDEKGVKQFSDLPPPANIPKKNIIKGPVVKPVARPGSEEGTPSASDPAASGGNAANIGNAPPAPPAPPTYAERNAEFKKRRLEQAEKDKKEADDSARAAARKKNCELARDYQRTIDSGIRITNTDKNGERNVMTDEERNRATRENRQILEGCK